MGLRLGSIEKYQIVWDVKFFLSMVTFICTITNMQNFLGKQCRKLNVVTITE